MLINLKEDSINFDLESEIPFFQSPNDNRVRFDIGHLDKSQISYLYNSLFTNASNTKCSFLSEYLSPIKFKEKTRIGRFISITNWREDIHSQDDTYVISTIEGINNDEGIHYLLYIQRGLVNPYIIFYNDDYLLYVSNDVIDIISSSTAMITTIKSKFSHVMNAYYEVK